MDQLDNLDSLLKQLLIFGIIILVISTVLFCNGKQTQKDLKNAISLTQTLKNNKSSAPKNFTPIPQHKNNETESYAVKQHNLKPGETLQDLAVLYDTDWQSIQRANGIKNLNELKPGQTILIPIKKSDQQ